LIVDILCLLSYNIYIGWRNIYKGGAMSAGIFRVKWLDGSYTICHSATIEDRFSKLCKYLETKNVKEVGESWHEAHDRNSGKLPTLEILEVHNLEGSNSEVSRALAPLKKRWLAANGLPPTLNKVIVEATASATHYHLLKFSSSYYITENTLAGEAYKQQLLTKIASAPDPIASAYKVEGFPEIISYTTISLAELREIARHTSNKKEIIVC
jgi:hypothetical protein